LPNRKRKVWLTVLSSGLAVALFTFIANKTWEIYSHHSVGPKYVDTTIRFEEERLFFFVRNNSDEPLDLIGAKIQIDEPELFKNETLGAYPDVSKVYEVSVTSGSAKLEIVDNRLVMRLKIIQEIAPKAADHFGVTLVGLTGPVNLSNVKIRAELEDIKGNIYLITR
jgi:hypothetical protein